MKVLITGGAGFIGSNFVRHILNSRRGVNVINFDSLTYAGNPESLADVAENPRYQFIRGDITDSPAVDAVFKNGLDALVNFAAETHVDRSIEDATPFLRTNILGTQCLLDTAKRFKLSKFVQISTDEVYGSAPAGLSFTEETVLDPRSPYAASKASADHFVSAYANTYGVSAVVLRCTNNYGPYQFPEKLIPLMVANAREDEISQLIEEHSANWRLARMPAVDRNVLRTSIAEMLGFPGTPVPIIINESLEIARRYSAPESINFLNGVLDAIAKSRVKAWTPG